MLTYIRVALTRGLLTRCTISQRGGGFYRDVGITAADEVGVVITNDGETHLIPWSSINEIKPS